MVTSILQRVKTAYAVSRLTRRYYRANQIPYTCNYYVNGYKINISGPDALVMLIGIVLNDTYGLKRFQNLESIVDIGANIGIFSIYAATLFPESKIIAYEPCSETFSNLKKNVDSFNVEVYPCAVGQYTGKVNLSIEGDLTACYVANNNGSINSSQVCDMISFQEIADKMDGSIDILKLDCEGSEYEIMQSPSFNCVQYVVGEFHTCEQGNPKYGLELLKQRGFTIEQWLPFPDGKAGEFWARNDRKFKGENYA
ncbi:MAG: FkbM family methyltransferase [Roseofilum sp. SBFL]|uniref:FkbM family methyltransferase n=1 Tax=unclassified Roseofilum TaxID=2620099 RepID=UPI001B14E671|nr:MULTISPECIES: FkbM family methyltransferase [unclassified Roseofilum]MBP0014390.1 FkbM family methyltransferase [Roseofilum sp. SID3]MBP0025955.1 FkbM family methyltransferase [Roseofilum sp. SID2]MBP0036127.1 FkbM family methyltransferase [Roseofilum sp. SID1]MBP0040495.1 FkbM family methyltransferase [Roseofilum sp. SBFL]